MLVYVYVGVNYLVRRQVELRSKNLLAPLFQGYFAHSDPPLPEPYGLETPWNVILVSTALRASFNKFSGPTCGASPPDDRRLPWIQ